MNILAEIDRERARLERIARVRETLVGMLMFVLVIGGLIAEFLVAAWFQGWAP